MIYVIQQRLEAQKISQDKSRKVLQDIVSTMFNDQFIDELFKPQHMYSRSAMQTVFEKLVHSSIMRLNSSSMGKLYDLMLMVFKYQVVNCPSPEDILCVTLNHMDAIRNCALPYPDLKKRTESVFSLLISTYKDLSHEEYKCIYECIVAFLKDLNIRVSVLMKLGLQLQTGEIIIQNRNELKSNLEKVKSKYKEHASSLEGKGTLQNVSSENRFDLDGKRGICLGTNIYMQSSLIQTSQEQDSSTMKSAATSIELENPQVVEEITLLGRLIGKLGSHDFVPEIILSTNEEEEFCPETSTKENCSFVNIDATQVRQSELGQISNEFYLAEKKNEKCDILELLDIAEKDEI
ncbi:hypothetical protein JTE90_021558 [Oedothorax gibbosus]|uniref:Protein OSCP1 n=1 Tax=Oedothorax gibbosus TaxID=931172 RepID=A0AAV6VP28_9ARAC|nr:hypothetical protein JTE90_021558 [Oedothorax gibbosus]